MVVLRNRERDGGHFELEIGIVGRAPEDSLVHKLGVEGGDVLRCGVYVVNHLVKVLRWVGLVNQVAAKAVREGVLEVAHFIGVLVEALEVVECLICSSPILLLAFRLHVVVCVVLVGDVEILV